MSRQVRSGADRATRDSIRRQSSGDDDTVGGNTDGTRQTGRRRAGASADPSFDRPSLAQQRQERRRQTREKRLRRSIITPSGVRRIEEIDADRPVRRRRKGFWASMRDPIICYYGFIICVALLLILGLVMVFSSSSVNLIATGQSPYHQVLLQSLYAFVGVVCAVLVSRPPVSFYRRISFGFFVFTLFLQALTLTRLGASAGGNSGWIVIGPVSFQPAELLKLSLCLWMPSSIVSSRNARRYGRGFKEQVKPYAVALLGLGLAFALVMAGKDLGTGLVILLIGVVALLCGGLDARLMLTGVALLGAGIIGVFVTGSGNRMQRIHALFSGCQGSDDKLGVCYQVIHGRFALASGGLFGLGLGASREKWSYLPEAQNDFIFAVIGEELGFVGALAVILLFALIAWFLLQVAVQMRPPAERPTTAVARVADHQRQYARIVLVCITGWICFQALINIMVVLQLAPVIGLPLPFVSAGGTALVSCLTASGVAAAMMREQPQIAAVFPPHTSHKARRRGSAAARDHDRTGSVRTGDSRISTDPRSTDPRMGSPRPAMGGRRPVARRMTTGTIRPRNTSTSGSDWRNNGEGHDGYGPARRTSGR